MMNTIPILRCAALVSLMLTVAAITASTANAQESDDKPLIELLTTKILVVDPDGNPVEEATVYCTGMRTKIQPGSHWGWDEKIHGPLPKLKTNSDGIVDMPYPKYVEEKLDTGYMTWTVEHPGFVPFREDRNVEEDPAEIKLALGFRIAVTAVDAKSGEKIKDDLYAVIGGSRADWELKKNGMLVSPTFAKSDTTLRVCQFVEGQPTLFSEAIKIEPGDRSRVLLKDVKLSLGTRVEGKLEVSVERPIENGYVSATIVKSSDNGRTRWSWTDKAIINEDGTFVFESLPRDEVLQLIPVCDGWVPSNPEKAEVAEFFPTAINNLGNGMTMPQLCKLKGDKITPILKMTKSTSVRVTVQKPDGQPLAGAEIVMWPNQYLFDFGSQVLGAAYATRDVLTETRAGGYEWDLTRRFQSITDENGVGVIHNLPTNKTSHLAVSHDDFDMPISDADQRVARVDLQPDKVAEVTIKMQNKGADALGEAIDPKEDLEDDENGENEKGKNNDKNEP